MIGGQTAVETVKTALNEGCEAVFRPGRSRSHHKWSKRSHHKWTQRPHRKWSKQSNRNWSKRPIARGRRKWSKRTRGGSAGLWPSVTPRARAATGRIGHTAGGQTLGEQSKNSRGKIWESRLQQREGTGLTSRAWAPLPAVNPYQCQAYSQYPPRAITGGGEQSAGMQGAIAGGLGGEERSQPLHSARIRPALAGRFRRRRLPRRVRDRRVLEIAAFRVH